MARKFSWPAVQLLEVGQSCGIPRPVSEVKRKVALYGLRCGKRFKVEPVEDCSLVTRDPVTDAELPGA